MSALYAKFYTALLAAFITYTQIYGFTWHAKAAMIFMGGALAVLGVPNKTKIPPPPG